MSDLLPGQARIVREEACPEHMMSHTNEYFLLNRAAMRLMDNGRDLFWRDAFRRAAVFDAIEVLRDLAAIQPVHPCKSWILYGSGIVREIRCPGCSEIFEWKGNFYVPQCPKCKGFLRKRKEVNAAHAVRGRGPRHFQYKAGMMKPKRGNDETQS